MTITASADNLARVAEGQVNYSETGGRDGKSGNLTKFGAEFGLNGYAWCSIFVWWCFHQLGIDVRHVISANYAGAEQAMEGFQRKGWKIVKNPRRGDVVFFHFNGEHAGANHTGIVVGVDANGVWTVEGNTSAGTGSQVNGGGVYRRYRHYDVIIGFGRYPFTAPSVVHPTVIKPVAAKTYPTLQVGSKGGEVVRMQNLLHVHADGDFGPATKKAVVAYQQTHGLVADGVAGPATLAKLGY